MLDESYAEVRAEFARLVEDVAFTVVEPLEQGRAAAESGDLTTRVTVEFTGQRQGKIILFCPSEFGGHIAEAVMGLDGEAPDQGQAADASRELLNVVAGNLVTTLYGTDTDFELSVPSVEEHEQDSGLPSDALFFDVDGYVVALSIEPEGNG